MPKREILEPGDSAAARIRLNQWRSTVNPSSTTEVKARIRKYKRRHQIRRLLIELLEGAALMNPENHILRDDNS